MSFHDELRRHDWRALSGSIRDKTARDVESALDKSEPLGLDDFEALVSPAAAPYLERMAQLSHRRTLARFGRTIQLYIPLYLSNVCTNICVYCGFSHDRPVPRHTLSIEEISEEAEAIKRMGLTHLLLVTGEAPKTVGVDYFERALDVVVPRFAQVSMEVQPLDENGYGRLIRRGLHGVYLYQETYREDRYRDYHPRGMKTFYERRLETPEHLGRAGIHRTGLGFLLGLEDWRVEACCLAMHLRSLQRRYWRTKYSISFPRLRPAEGGYEAPAPVSDRELVQLICAYRLLDDEVELSLSTRESAELRDHAIKLGITTMSAGSRTEPGGYARQRDDLEQFSIDDRRSPQEVAAAIRRQGYEPVWKAWEKTA